MQFECSGPRPCWPTRCWTSTGCWLVKRRGNLACRRTGRATARCEGGYDNEIAVLSPRRPDGKLTTLYRPENGSFVGDVDLHFDADRMLFSMPGHAQPLPDLRDRRRRIGGLRQVTPAEARRRQLRRLLPARRPDHLRLDRLLPRRALRRRRRSRWPTCTS